MKELLIEEKAKRYDEAIKRAKKVLLDCTPEERKVVEYISPELAESEDERIRKGLIEYFLHYPDHEITYYDLKADFVIAWLEKKPVISYDALREGIGHFGITQYQIDNWLKKYVDVEKQGEQKQELLTKEKALKNSPFVEQKPTEWSEKDEDTLHCIIDALDSLDIRTNTNGEHEDHTEEINWLKSLKDRVQTKQEWSEEDDKMIDSIAVHLNATTSGFPEERAWAERFMNWLKSLRPQSTWKPSDEQIYELTKAVDYYTSHGFPNKILNELLKHLKNL